MRDLIDLGNQVFNVLKDKYGEIEESRMLFLYFITQKNRWDILGSNHWIVLDVSGIVKNFADPEIDQLNQEWLALKERVDYEFLVNKLNHLRKEYDRPAPKDGDIWEFGANSGTFRDIYI